MNGVRYYYYKTVKRYEIPVAIGKTKMDSKEKIRLLICREYKDFARILAAQGSNTFSALDLL